MKSSELSNFIEVRNRALSSDEILNVIDAEQNPQIDHIIYENGLWQIWDKEGNYFSFVKR